MKLSSVIPAHFKVLLYPLYTVIPIHLSFAYVYIIYVLTEF